MTSFSDMLAGYRRFRETGWAQQRERWDELRDGQSPKVMIIACSSQQIGRAHV